MQVIRKSRRRRSQNRRRALTVSFGRIEHDGVDRVVPGEHRRLHSAFDLVIASCGNDWAVH